MEQNVIQINVGIAINVDASIKNILYVKKDYILNPATCDCKNCKYLASIMNDSTIICDEGTKSYDEGITIIPTSFNEKKLTCKIQSFYILLAFLLITITLLVAVSFYCCWIKYQGKHLLPFHSTNDKLSKFDNDSIH